MGFIRRSPGWVGLRASAPVIALLGLLLITACRPAPTENASRAQQGLLGAATPPNFRIFDAYFENTAKVFPPGPSCPNGSISFTLGQPRPGQLLRRPLRDGAGNIDTTTPTSSFNYPANATTAIGTDNQLIRLRDGSFFAEKDASVWDVPSPPPSWINETVTGPGGDQTGQRGAIVLFRSTDCGQSWQPYSTIDFATLSGGIYGEPRPMADDGRIDVSCAEQGHFPGTNRQRWWIGGEDRTEVYACPFTGNVYVTTRIVSGPICDAAGNPTDAQRDTGLLIFSNDNGLTWQVIKDDLADWSPMVMTSTPDGRLFIFQSINTQPTVYYSQPLSAGQAPVMNGGFPAFYVDGSGTAIPNQAGTDIDLFYQAFHPSVSRIGTRAGTSRIRASYHSTTATGMQQTRVVGIEVPPGGGTPIITPIATVQPEDPADHSVLYFSFVDPDFIDIPAGTTTNVSMAYWIEPPRCRPNEHRCSQVCVDVTNDPANCGACGTACASGQLCSQGACVAACGASETLCNGANCVDTSSNVRNCGGCNVTCNFNQLCSAGHCVDSGNGKRGYSIRHMFFEGDCRATSPKLLSVSPDQSPRYFDERPHSFDGFSGLGDYMYGGFWWENGLNYLGQWQEGSAGLIGATTRSPFGTSSPPTTTCQDVTALCQDVVLSAGPTCTATVTADRVDNGSFAAQGAPVSLGLSSSGPFGLGTATVTLTASSGSQSASCTAHVTVNDVSPPTVTPPPDATGASCAANGTINVGQATGSDNCAHPPSISGQVISKNGVTLATPIPVVGGQVALGPGTYVIQWTASDGPNVSPPAFQTVTVRAVIEARDSFLVDDRARVQNSGGGFASVLNAGTGATRLGNDAHTGGIVSVGPVTVQHRAIVDGDVVSGGAITRDSDAVINGGTTAFASVVLPALPTLPAFPPPVGPARTINSGATFSPQPGSYASLTLNSGATLVLASGTYFFDSLFVNSTVTVRATATTRVFVRAGIALRSSFRSGGGAVQSVVLGYAGGSLVVEAPFNGTLVAPNASVAFGAGAGLTFTGAFYGRGLEVRSDSALVCQTSAAAPPAL